jgi:hypothetical protein
MRAGLLVGLALLVATPGASSLPAQRSDGGDRPLRTAVHLHLPGETYPEAFSTAFRRTAGAGATMVRLPVVWSEVAPVSRPADFEPEDPGHPSYRWKLVDETVRQAARYRLEPLVFFVDAPKWAEAPRRYAGHALSSVPDPDQIAAFARALARRYSGAYGGLPRVRYWEAWNEPNISLYFHPQLLDNRPISPLWYREVLTKFTAAVRSARSDNFVVAGGTAPFRDITPDVLRQRSNWGPLSFMRELLCLSRSLRPTCNTTVPFDAWAHHPYTSGGPTHRAVFRDDVSLGDLPEMKRVLDAAVRAGHVAARRGGPEFWVTEFSWDSRPPDPKAVPPSLLNRWVAEGLYRMWTNGVSVVTWFTLRDQPLATSFYQSGLYYRGARLAADRPKPHLTAFRFPVVAFRDGKEVMVWGRTPAGRRGTVIVEQRAEREWRRLGTASTSSDGIFQARFRTRLPGDVRARSGGAVSLGFSLRRVRDRFFNPFGLPNLLEPRGN